MWSEFGKSIKMSANMKKKYLVQWFLKSPVVIFLMMCSHHGNLQLVMGSHSGQKGLKTEKGLKKQRKV